MSEIKDIPLGGVSNEPNDYSHEEGGLSVSLNAVKHHGSIRPVLPGSPVNEIGNEGALPKGMDLLAIHEVGEMKHYILQGKVQKQEGPAGARPVPGQPLNITVHYICLPAKVKIWWTSSYGDYFAGWTLQVIVGAGSMWDWVQIPYNTTVEVDAALIAVSATYGTDGELTSHTMYDYYDPTLHVSKDCMGVYAIIKDDGSASLAPDDLSVEYAKELPVTNINISVICHTNEILLGYSSTGYIDIGKVRVRLGEGQSTMTTDIESGKTVALNPETLSVGRRFGEDVMYSYPDAVLTEETVYLLSVYSASAEPEPGLRDAEGNFSDTFNVTTTVIVAEDQNVEIETGSSTFFPDNEEATHLLYYLDATQENKTPIFISKMASEAISVTPIGNVLTVAAKGKPLNYIIWKDEEYHVLGSRYDAPRVYPYLFSKPMGEADLLGTFGADFMSEAPAINVVQQNTLEYSKWKRLYDGKTQYLTFNATERKYLSDKAFALINSAHQILSRKGYFYAPFYVRFAFRMFDGKHIMHTPPQLMIAGAAGKPYVGVAIDGNTANLHPIIVASRIHADIEAATNRWRELITHIDVFVSKPLIDYSDDTEAILGAMAIVEDNETSSTVRQPNMMYQNNRKQLSNALTDYSSASKSQYISINYYTQQGGKAYSSGTKKDTMQDGVYFLVDKSRYPNIRILFESGANYRLEDASEDMKIGITSDGNDILLRDTGLTNLSNYLYIKMPYSQIYAWQNYNQIDFVCLELYKKNAAGQSTKFALDLARTDGSNYRDEIQDNNTFHLVKSIPMEDLENGWHGDLFIDENILDNLTSREALNDNGQMRSVHTVGAAPFGYNNRLSVATKTLSLPSTSCLADYCAASEPEQGKGWYIEKAWVQATVNGQVIYRRLEVATDNNKSTYAENIRYFYYPCYDATHLILQVLNEDEIAKPCQVHVHKLNKHKLLNGAYLFNNFDVITPAITKKYTTRQALIEDEHINKATSGPTESIYGNLVRVSGVSNPFYFNEVNQVTLPTGTISGLSTTAKALSQGQFGAFPLYCFSDNGIWALEVSEEGTYSAKQPVSRTVCTNPESITQTEGQVLFVTKRGLMALDGANVSCVSEVLSGHNYTATIEKLNKVMEIAGFEGVSLPNHIEEWMQDARFLYDDMRQYIYAFKSDDTLGYIYSISDQAWGMFVNDLEHPLPTYTDALAVEKDAQGQRRLINMSDYNQADHESSYKSLLITRPMTLGTADAYKTIEALVLRGMIDEDDAKLVIWASNDLKQWEVIASSSTSWYRGRSGTPYKYYRIGVLLDWEEEDSLNGMSADITTRLTNRIR